MDLNTSFCDAKFIRVSHSTLIYFQFELQIPMIILYVIGIPVVAFLLLRHNKHKLNDLAVKQKYGFLYSVRHAIVFPLGVFQARVTDIELAFVYRTLCSFLIATQGYLIGEKEGDDSWYYWELLVVARKIAIIVISVRSLSFFVT